jgi:hypothetical protein
MSAIHTIANVHVTVRSEQNARDHRDGGRAQRPVGHGPVVVDHRDNDRGRNDGHDRYRDSENDRDRDHRIADWSRDRFRPIIVAPTPAPVVVTTSPGYSIDPGYTYQPAPIQVLGSTELDHGSIAIDTAAQLDGATSLQLFSTGTGSTYVSQVVLYQADGSYQVVTLDTMLSAENPSTAISIGNGYDIVKVIVNGHSNWGGAIAIDAR